MSRSGNSTAPSPGERLRRIEPLAPLALATTGVILLSWGIDGAWERSSDLWQWVVVCGVGLLGLLGMLGLHGPLWLWFRALAIMPAAWFLSASFGGSGSPFTIWFVVGMVVYPLVLPERLAWWYPAVAGAGYASLMAAPESTLPGVEVFTRVFLFTILGYLLVELGRVSIRLAAEHARAEADLRFAEVRFDAAFAAASSGMAITDLDLRILQSNRALSDFLQRTEAELASASLSDLLHPDDVGLFRERIADLVDAELWSFQVELRFLRPKWQVVSGLVGASVVAGDAGEARFVFVHIQDITQRIRAEHRLRRSEEHYRNLFGRSPVAIWELDYTEVGKWLESLRESGIVDLRRHLSDRPDRLREAIDLITVDDVNDAAVRLFEAPGKAELLAGFSGEMLTPQLRDAIAEQLHSLWEGRDRVDAGVSTRTVRGRAIEGIVHWVVPTVEDRPDLSKVVFAFSDVTEYQRTQEALRLVEERLRNVVGAAPIILFALDGYGVFTLAEGQGLGVLSVTPGEVLGRSVFEMFRESPQMIRAVRRGLSGEGFTTAVEIRDLVFDIRFTPIWESGAVAGVIGVANDVTDRKRASERLEELIRSKDEFVASVSHELRTPLTAVVGFAQELRENRATMSAEDENTYIGLIASQAVEVADLVEDLLVAARMDIDKVSVYPEPIEVGGQIEDALASWPAEFAASVERNGGPVKAFADPIRVRQILRNLLANAERYGGARIAVNVRKEGEVVLLEVSDDGAGIPERDHAEIFEPYHRAHHDAGQPLSVGLGLTVSRQLARLMGGDLTYRYSDGWSRFTLTLPAVE